MEIKNLSQLKKALQKGRRFEVVEHYIKPDMTGIREVSVVQTNGIYSKFSNKPSDAKENTCNGGKGYWLSYGKAKDWVFENGTCLLTSTYKDKTEPVLKIVVLD